MESTRSRTNGDDQPSPVPAVPASDFQTRSSAEAVNANVDVELGYNAVMMGRDPNPNPNVMAQAPAAPAAPVEPLLTRIVKAFPYFMVAISFIQILTHYLGGPELQLYLGYDPYRRHEVWRFLTIMFVHSHSSAWHLWNNMIFQLIVGIILEIKQRWIRIGMIYLGGVVGGTLFITVFKPKVYTVGASAAGMALLFGHAATLVLNWKEMTHKAWRVCSLIGYIVVVVILIPFYNELIMKEDTVTSHAGHGGGAVMGFLISILVLKTFVSEPWPWEKKFRMICGLILILLTLVITITNVAFQNLYYKSEYNANYKESMLLWLFQTIEESPSPEDSQYLIECLKSEECADAWDAYRNGSRSFKDVDKILF